MVALFATNAKAVYCPLPPSVPSYDWRCGATLTASGRAAQVLMKWSWSRSSRRHGDKQPLPFLPASWLHLPGGPATPVPAEVRIRSDILTSVPKSLIESVLALTLQTWGAHFQRHNLRGSLIKRAGWPSRWRARCPSFSFWIGALKLSTPAKKCGHILPNDYCFFVLTT